MMSKRRTYPGDARMALFAPLLVAALGWSACDLLDVTDPTRLEERDVANPTGADLMRQNALRQLFRAANVAARDGGRMTDEYQVLTIGAPDVLDIRAHNVNLVLYRTWHEARHAASLALERLDSDAAAERRSADIGQMLAARAYTVVRLGEDFCPGFPLHELDGYTTVYGEPIATTNEVLERALPDLTSALAHAGDNATVANLASVVLGRALLGLGRFSDAAQAVTAVPTEFAFHAEFGLAGVAGNVVPSNEMWRLTDPCCGPTASVGDRAGGNGLDFVSAEDSRVGTEIVGTVGDMPRHRTTKYANPDAPMVLASGIEARLIGAEAALAAGGPWLEILNELRATQVSPSMDPLNDPGDPDARVDLLFRERAFWLFGTGQRLSDLRRLVRLYERPSESVFPTGIHFTGQPYGTDTGMHFPWEAEAQFNPSVAGCTGP